MCTVTPTLHSSCVHCDSNMPRLNLESTAELKAKITLSLLTRGLDVRLGLSFVHILALIIKM